MAPKRKAETLEEALSRVWCYYCERDFPHLKDLCDHQRSKHFRCTFDPRSCNRKLQTAGGLKVHMQQVHKSDLKEVPNADPGRAGLEPEIFAMNGVPEHLKIKHDEAIIKRFQTEEAEYMKRTGNSLRGTNEPNKKPKVDAIAGTEDQKARARAFKERKMLQRKLRDEAIARGEEPPKFDAITPTVATPITAPAASPPTAVAAMEPSISPPAAAAWQMPPGNGLPQIPKQPAYAAHPLPMAPHNAYSPQPMYNPYNPAGLAMSHPSMSPGMHQPYQMARPPPVHSAELFREQHPLHGMPSLPPALPSHLPPRPSGLSAPPSSVPPPVSQFSPATPEEIETMIDDQKRIVDAQKQGIEAHKQANEMSQKTVAQPDTKLNTNSSSELPIRGASKHGGMLMQNSTNSWEEKRGQHPRYQPKGPKTHQPAAG